MTSTRSMALGCVLLCLLFGELLAFVSCTHIKSKIILRQCNGFSGSKIEDVRSPLFAQKYLLAASISIGEPPVSQLLQIDTGSDLSWIQCYPCDKCGRHSRPKYYPSKSSTYNNVTCTESYCQSPYETSCDNASGHCLFKISYVDTSSSNGIVIKDNMRFTTSDEGSTSISNMVFGCARKNNIGGGVDGILGLGFSFISIVNQIGNLFSYCLGSITDPTYAFHQLILGDGAILQGASTPLEIYNSNYYVTIVGIRIGNKQLSINRNMFGKPNQNAGVLIDSGSTLTYLTRRAYELVTAEVQQLTDGVLSPIASDNKRLCYKGLISKDLIGFPVLAFQFAQGAELVLQPDSLFDQAGANIICLSLVMSEEDAWMQDSNIEHKTIIGIRSQQHHNIGFDLAHHKLYLQYVDCELLED